MQCYHMLTYVGSHMFALTHISKQNISQVTCPTRNKGAVIITSLY